MAEPEPADRAPTRPRHGRQFVADGAHFDFVIVGSGFGGSVSALRLSQKGYSVLVIEKGRRLSGDDFPKTNWNLKRWLWMPSLGFRGLFQMTFFRHLTAFTGVGVGGGSLVYANTLPHPRDDFFAAPSWSHLADWKTELEPHYQEARRMLGAARNPRVTLGDETLRAIAVDIGREADFDSNEVAVFFGPPRQTVPDPFFGGDGPERTGCRFCGACMTGCRFGSKNSLDKNYLFLAEGLGAQVQPDAEVTAVRPRDASSGEGGYRVEATLHRGWLRNARLTFNADQVVFAGGVLGTVNLLQAMKDDPRGLPRLSDRVGDFVRTNSEALIGVTTGRRGVDLAEGIAITSILHTDEHSHLEPVRYGRGSGFFRLLMSPHATGRGFFRRVGSAFKNFFRRPGRWFKALFVWDWAKHTQILLYMRTLEGTLRLGRGRSLLTGFRLRLRSSVASGGGPQASMPEATELAERFADKLGGVTASLVNETLLDSPSTAHILGGCAMGATADEGVIDARQRVFGYDGLYVCDGSAMSANPGVNPSLTIPAMTERAMSLIPPKRAQ
ncbi:MAG: GMC family oxidoreductase [Alphaproteobacteria bacterium HGW-Alphaproteobacteria-11]|nr:MAG: GMC family oxidoreductase [Alphaproteobacteria bacterium HGW-Alphaproteobacteria-11]